MLKLMLGSTITHLFPTFACVSESKSHINVKCSQWTVIVMNQYNGNSVIAPPRKCYCLLRKCARPQSRWMQLHPQRKLCKKSEESSWIYTCSQPKGRVNHTAYLWDHWGCVGGLVPKAQRAILLSAEGTRWAEGAGPRHTVGLPRGMFWVIADSGINCAWTPEQTAELLIVFDEHPKVPKFPSANDLHTTAFGSWMSLSVGTWKSLRRWMESSPKWYNILFVKNNLSRKCLMEASGSLHSPERLKILTTIFLCGPC